MAELREQPFSRAWVVVSVIVFTALELLIALLLSPAVLSGRLASPMLQMRLDILMHLASFYVGGLVVGVISPGVRLREPAVGAFISVAVIFLTSFFTPSRFLHFSLERLIIGGAIAFVLALMGAYTGERWMGNVESKRPASRRAALRRQLWGPEGEVEGGWLGSRVKETERR